MKDELLKRLLPIMDKTTEGVGQAIEKLKEQCPLLVQELLRWEFTISLLWFILGCILSIFAAKLIYRMWKWAKNGDDDGKTEDKCTAALFGAMFLGGICGAILLVNTAWLKIAIAPRLFLIEYVTNLLK